MGKRLLAVGCWLLGKTSLVVGRWSLAAELGSAGRTRASAPTWFAVITSAAVLFRVVMDFTAASIQACSATPFLIAVEITPVPSAFVSSKQSPAWAPAFLSMFFGFAMPVTEYPNLVSSSRML